MEEQQTTPITPPEGMGYVIRIHKPEGVGMSSLETMVFKTLEQTEYPLGQIRSKLDLAGYENYEIHIVNQDTGMVERTFRHLMELLPGMEGE